MGTAITTYVKVPYQLKSALHQLQGHYPNLLKLLGFLLLNRYDHERFQLAQVM